ncbi:unnamed protein product [Protopolystoma xenopodis]|uniref:Uncharacterized protein n=1 Tax=Protopolystoma xenopodis TaxID=117903 RepID=A0A448XG59_9PLAT|nr:unnamed protein product [Protopolystoma xenopodis]
MLSPQLLQPVRQRLEPQLVGFLLKSILASLPHSGRRHSDLDLDLRMSSYPSRQPYTNIHQLVSPAVSLFGLSGWTIESPS